MSNRKPIDVWFADLTFPNYMNRLLRIGEQFNRAHPDHPVNIQGLDFRTLPLQMARAAEAGRPPAVCEFYFTVTQAARDLGGSSGEPQFTTIDSAIDGRHEILGEPVVTDDLVPAVRDYYTYDGELASLPAAGTTPLLYANLGMLEAAGVSEIPRTWAGIEAACEAVAALPSGPPHRITWANHGLFFQQALATQGGALCDRADGRAGRATKVELASPEMLAWVGFWQRLHRAGHYLYTGKIPDWAGTFRAFAEQRVAMRISSSADVGYMVKAAADNGFEIGVARFPYNQDVPYVANAVAGASLWLAGGLDAATRDGALAFLQFLSNDRNDAARHKADSSIPVTGGGYALLAAEGWFDEHPYHRVASDQLNSYPPELAGPQRPEPPPMWGPLFGDFSGAQDAMTRAMGDVLARGADPAARFGQATVEAQRMLDDYHADRTGAGVREQASLRVEYFAEADAYSAVDLEDVVRLHS